VLFCIQFALIGITVFGAIYVQDLLGYDPVKAGLALLPLTIPVLIVAPLSGRLYDRIGPRGPVTAGTLLVGASLLWIAAVLHEFSYGWLVPGYVAAGIGIALVMSPSNTDAMNAAPPDLRGQASGVDPGAPGGGHRRPGHRRDDRRECPARPADRFPARDRRAG
jgi:MFS family permease